MSALYDMMRISPKTAVLDVGGTMFNWKLAGFMPDLTILNVCHPDSELPPGVKWVVGDARAMSFDDKSFEVVFSNSVIEHVGNWEDQKRFAEEVRRVGKCYFIQTPNYEFPIEPHLITPFVHWFPRRVQRALLPICVRSLIARSVFDAVRVYNEVRLLKPIDVKILFSDAEIMYESFFGLRKSIYAVKRC